MLKEERNTKVKYSSPIELLKKEADLLPKEEKAFVLNFMTSNFRGAFDLCYYFKKKLENKD